MREGGLVTLRLLCSFLLGVSVLLPPTLPTAQTLRADPQLEKIVQEVRAEINPSEAMSFVLRTNETDRWFTFPKFHETARYLEATMKAIGLHDVERLAAPADGMTQFGFWTMPLAWDVKEAVLEIVEPAHADTRGVLADYRKTPASLVMWSGPTPPDGIIADVVELTSFRPDDIDRDRVKGKMVLAEVPRDLALRGWLKARLYKMGAAGLISDATENPQLVDGHYWINAWGDHGWGFTKTSSPLVGFSITPRQGAYLRRLLAEHGRVRLKAVVDSRYYSGSYPYATGILQGSGSEEEEVLQLGHTSEPGANDNATGVAAMLASVAALNRLIDSGTLTRPQRSIRILAMPEDYGSMAYLATHPGRVARTIGAICVDTAAGPYDAAGTAYRFHLNPDVARSYQDALIMRVAESYYAGLDGRVPRWAPYRPVSDSFLSDPLIGIPTIMPRAGTGVDVHHNSADTVDLVDPRSLRDLSSILAIYTYYLASADEQDVAWLAEITADRGYNNILRAAEPYLSRVATLPDGDALGRELSSGLAKITYEADRDQDAVLSTLQLAREGRRKEIRASLEPLLQNLQRFADEQSERLRRAVNRRAGEVGAAGPVEAAAPPVNSTRARAAHMVVKRKRMGTITLDDLPVDQRDGFPGFGAEVPILAILNWVDGERTLEEVIRLTELERGPMDFDFVGYFEFLARHGYVDIVSVNP
ncbi:MAG: DUF4910 domain-containing protein [Luteitalea sp.]|nr:DUF4910 domain-containing protein [Luteitalea sp.]